MIPLQLVRVFLARPPTLNAERLHHVFTAWEQHRPDELSPAAVAKKERLLPPTQPWSLCLGVSIDELVGASSEPTERAAAVRELLMLHAKDKYVLGGCAAQGTLRAVLKEGASAKDELQAAWHAYKAAQRLSMCQRSLHPMLYMPCRVHVVRRWQSGA